MNDLNVIIHVGTIIRKLVKGLCTVVSAYRKLLKQLLDHVLMGLMENSGKQGFALCYIKIIHDHLIIIAVFFAWHKLEFITFTAEINPL